MTKIKFFKFFTQIFVVKQEKEIEIGFPTDVKHVAHIGWDGPSGTSAPTWMNDFKSPPDFSTTTSANPKTSPDYDQSTQKKSAPAAFDGNQPSDPGSAPRKPRRKKKTTTTDASQKSPPKSKRSRQAKTKSNKTKPKTDLELEV